MLLSKDDIERVRQALDDAMLTHTGRSIGDVASQTITLEIVSVIQNLMMPKPPGAYSVMVNGVRHYVKQPTLTYEDVVRLAVFLTDDAEVRPGYSITYRHGTLIKPDGILSMGSRVQVVDGLIFNVAMTGNA